MKIQLISALITLSSFASFGQKSSSVFVNNKSQSGTEKVIYDAHWAGFDFGFNTMMSSPFKRDFDANPYWENNIANSIQFNMGIWEYKIPIVRQYLGITTGMGFSISSYSFKNDAMNYTLQYTADTTYAQVFSPGVIYNDTIDGKLRYKLGVIDFLTKYDGMKFLENEFKSKLHQVDKM